MVNDANTDTPIFNAAVMRDTREYARLLRRLELHVERMPVALITVDALGHIRGWNPAAERMLGHSAAAARGAPVQDLVGAPRLLEIITAGGVSDEVVEVRLRPASR